MKEINVPRSKTPRSEEMLPKRRFSFASIAKIKKRWPRPCWPRSCETFCNKLCACTISLVQSILMYRPPYCTILERRTAQSMAVTARYLLKKHGIARDRGEKLVLSAPFAECVQISFSHSASTARGGSSRGSSVRICENQLDIDFYVPPPPLLRLLRVFTARRFDFESTSAGWRARSSATAHDPPSSIHTVV